MSRPKKIVPIVGEVKDEKITFFKISPVEFADLNTLKDKLNEVIAYINR